MQQVELESERHYVHAAYTNDYESLEASTSCYLSLVPVTPPESLPLSPTPRKNHDRKRPEEHIPRPPNAFMLYRSDFLKKGIIPPDIESKQQNISRVVGACWKRLSSVEQSVWRTLAKHKEMEHAIMYPDYQYKPVKRGQVKRRRKTLTTEEEEEHCNSLRERYLPDKAGPVVHHEPPPPSRKRKSRAKPGTNAPLPTECAAPSPPPPPTLPAASIRESHSPIFMDPLVRPTSQPTRKQELWHVQPHGQSWENFDGSAAGIASLPRISHHNSYPYPEFEINVGPGFDFYSLPPPPLDKNFQDDIDVDVPEWSEASAQPLQDAHMEEQQELCQPYTTSTSTISIPPPPLQVAAHIREQYNTACRKKRVPTAMSDAHDAQVMFESQPFFIASRPIRPVEVQPHVDELGYPEDEAAAYPPANPDPAPFHLQPYPPSSPAPSSNSALFPSVSSYPSPAPSPSLELKYPQDHSHTMDAHPTVPLPPLLTGFPMTLHAAITPASSSESAPCLQPPVFDIHAAVRHELDALTLSLDTSSAALQGLRVEGEECFGGEVGGQTALFGGMAHLEGHGQWTGGVMEDALMEEVCVRESR